MRNDFVGERIREEMETGRGVGPLALRPVSLTPPFRPMSWEAPRAGWFGRTKTQARPRSPEPLGERPRLVVLRLRLEREAKVGPEAKAALLRVLSALKGPFSLEAVTGEEVILQLTCRREEQEAIAQSVRALLPGAELREEEDRLPLTPLRVGYALAGSHFFPLRTKISPDPATCLLALRTARPLALQLLFQPLGRDWEENIRRASRDPLTGRSPFKNLSDLPKWAEEKTRSGLFAVALTVGVHTEDEALLVEGFLAQFASAENRFRRLPGTLPQNAMTGRLAYRPGMVLSTAELAELFPLPTEKAALARLAGPTRTAPAPKPNGQPLVVLGANPHQGRRRLVGLSQDDLTRHVAIFGRTHSGKSNLLAHFAGLPSGLCLIDFHGDLAEAYLRLLPAERVNETLYFNVGDEACPAAFNPLAGSARRGDVLVSDMLVAFRRYFGREFWGPRMEMVLRNALLALMHHPEELTLLDLQAFFLSAERRRAILERVEDPAVRSFWRDYFPRLARGAVHPIVNKLDKLLGTSHLQSVLGRPDRVDIEGTIREGRALIVNLSRGVIGEAESELLAYLLVAKIHVALLSRAGVPPEERRLFALICDEFQCLGGAEGSSRVFASLFSEVRKFGGAVVVAAQYVGALDREVQAALFGNVGTLVAFNVGVSDAAALSKELGCFETEDLLNLGVGEALVRMGRSREAFNLKVPLQIVPREGSREAILERSRRHFVPAAVEQCLPMAGDAAPTEATPPGPATAPPRSLPEQRDPEASTRPAISAQERGFLTLLRERSFIKVREAYAALGLSGRRGDALKRSLLEKGLILEVPARTPQRADGPRPSCPPRRAWRLWGRVLTGGRGASSTGSSRRPWPGWPNKWATRSKWSRPPPRATAKSTWSSKRVVKGWGWSFR